MPKSLLSLLAALTFFSQLRADESISVSSNLDEMDLKAVREWLNTKRQVSVKEKGGSLVLSGEMRTEFQAINERRGGVRQRKPHGAIDEPSRGWDVNFNFMVDYRSDRSWAAARLKFDNNMGIESGQTDQIRLDKAFFGVRLVNGDTYTVSGEVGRRPMGTIFDSRIEFHARFDGILLKFDGSSEKWGSYYLHTGPFLINDKRDAYGVVGEIGMLDIYNTGLYFKYSLVDWNARQYLHDVYRKKYDFIVSQLILGYQFINRWEKPVIIYSAVAYNHLAKHRSITGGSMQPWAEYIGFSVGQLQKKNDWALDFCLQRVQAQAIPDFDAEGIGLGNTNQSGFYETRGVANTRKTAGGNVNYQGCSLQIEYLLTENLSLQQTWQQSITLNKHIGPYRRFKVYEMEFIYAF